MADIEEKPKSTSPEGDQGTGAIDEVVAYREDHRNDPPLTAIENSAHTQNLVNDGTLPGLELVHDGGAEPQASPSEAADPGISKRGVTRDENGRVDTVTDKNGNSTSFKYDENGNVTEFTIGNGDNDTTYKRQDGVYKAYDKDGNPILDSDGNQQTYTGDAFVDQSNGAFTMRNADGSYTKHLTNGEVMTVNNDGQMTSFEDPNTGKSWSFKYDANGELVQVGYQGKNYELGEDGKWYQLNDMAAGRAVDENGNPIIFDGYFTIDNYGHGNFSWGISTRDPREPLSPEPAPPSKEPIKPIDLEPTGNGVGLVA